MYFMFIREKDSTTEHNHSKIFHNHTSSFRIQNIVSEGELNFL